jgi:hypothetical protein
VGICICICDAPPILILIIKTIKTIHPTAVSRAGSNQPITSHDPRLVVLALVSRGGPKCIVLRGHSSVIHKAA